MGKKIKCVKISFERGRIGSGALIETKVFAISPETLEEEKIKPDRTTINRRTNRGKDEYFFIPGKKYHILTQRLNKGRTSSCSAILAVDRTGKINIEKWQGDFYPQFSLQ